MSVFGRQKKRKKTHTEASQSCQLGYLVSAPDLSGSFHKFTCLTLWGTVLGKVHYYIYNSLPLVPNLSQINPVHIFPLFSHFFKIQCSIIFLHTFMSSKQFLPFSFSKQNFIFSYHVLHAQHMPCPCHLSWFHHPKNICEETKLWSSLCSFHHTSSHIQPYSIQHLLYICP